MRDRMLFVGLHFAKGLAIAFRHEDGIVTKAFAAAGREGETAEDPAFKNLGCLSWRCKRQRANKPCP